MATIGDTCDYVIWKLGADGRSDLNALKLQKLLYYIQAWYLAFYKKPMFDGEFQAWVHGPVNREIYDRYKDKKFMYSSITIDDIENKNFLEALTRKERVHIDSILDSYAGYSPTQLEFLTHREDPWVEARKGVNQYERSENAIDEKLMGKFYRARLK